MYVYVDALRSLVADRHDILTGQHNELIYHEMSVASRQAKEGLGHSPKLLLKLLSIRDRLKPTVGSVRGIMTALSELKTTLRGATEKGNSRTAAELLIVNGALEKLHQISIEQTKAVAGLNREIELFKDTMNLRLEYYRQLQEISDTVAPYDEDLNEEARNVVLLAKKAAESCTKVRIARLKSKGRYLVHLRDEATNLESQKMCIICQQPFEVGILTSCGHSYCIQCLRLWWATHRNCPTCKKHLSRNDFHQITYVPLRPMLGDNGHEADRNVVTSRNNLRCRKKGKRKKREAACRMVGENPRYTQEFTTTPFIRLRTLILTVHLERKLMPSPDTYCGCESTTRALSRLFSPNTETFWMFWQGLSLNFELTSQASIERMGYKGSPTTLLYARKNS